MKTLSYVYGREEEIETGKELYFGQLWDGDGEGIELLESGSIAFYDKEADEEYIINFEVLEENEDVLKAVVRVTDIC